MSFIPYHYTKETLDSAIEKQHSGEEDEEAEDE